MRRLCSSATRRREWTCGASREPGVQSRLSAPGAERPRPTHARLAMTAHHAAHMDHAHDIGASGAARRACALHLPGSTARRHKETQLCVLRGVLRLELFPGTAQTKNPGVAVTSKRRRRSSLFRVLARLPTSDFRLPRPQQGMITVPVCTRGPFDKNCVSTARETQPAVSSFAATTRDGGCRLAEGRAPARRKAMFRPRE